MSGSEDEDSGGAGNREVAYRLFASEFDDADFSYSESDEERAPNYVVTPTGARVNRLFVAGVLTEIETVSEDYLRARVVDLTGPFVVYAGQYQPDALAFLERAEPPTFVAVTGKARTYQPEDSDRVFTSVRPESISEVDAATRDRWVVQTAEQTVDRVARFAEAKQSGLAGDELRAALEASGVDTGLAAGIPLAIEHYGTTGDYLQASREMALDAARVVAGDLDEVTTSDRAPDAGGDGPLAALAERELDVDAVETEETVEPSADVTADSGTDDSRAGTASAETETSEAGDATAETDETAGVSAESDETAGVSAESDDAAESVSTTEETTTATADASDGADETAVDAEPSTDVTETTEVADATETTGASESAEATETADAPTASAGAGSTTTAESATDETAASTVDESAEATETDAAATGETADDEDLGDFDPEFELDEDEREEIESEFGTEFQSGSEVEEPGEAGIDTPDPDELAEEADAGGDVEPATESAAASADAVTEDAEPAEAETPAPDADGAAVEGTDEEPAADDDEGADTDEIDEDVDLEDAVMDAMADLDDGDGADRDAVQAAVVDRTGADPGDVDDAIQDALMGGRCYEPDDATLKPI